MLYLFSETTFMELQSVIVQGDGVLYPPFPILLHWVIKIVVDHYILFFQDMGDTDFIFHPNPVSVSATASRHQTCFSIGIKKCTRVFFALVEPPPTKYYFKLKQYKPKRMCFGPPGCVLLVDETCTVYVINTTVYPWRHVRSIKVQSHFNAGVSGLGCVTIPSGKLSSLT